MIGKSGITYNRIKRWILNIYKFNALFIACEVVLILIGLSSYFEIIAGSATEVGKYKNYNTGAVLNYLGKYGANSLLLGSQSASQLIVFSIICFYPYYTFKEDRTNVKQNILWFVGACMTYPMVATMTANAIMIWCIFFLVLAIPLISIAMLAQKVYT